MDLLQEVLKWFLARLMMPAWESTEVQFKGNKHELVIQAEKKVT